MLCEWMRIVSSFIKILLPLLVSFACLFWDHRRRQFTGSETWHFDIWIDSPLSRLDFSFLFFLPSLACTHRQLNVKSDFGKIIGPSVIASIWNWPISVQTNVRHRNLSSKCRHSKTDLIMSLHAKRQRRDRAKWKNNIRQNEETKKLFDFVKMQIVDADNKSFCVAMCQLISCFVLDFASRREHTHTHRTSTTLSIVLGAEVDACIITLFALFVSCLLRAHIFLIFFIFSAIFSLPFFTACMRNEKCKRMKHFFFVLPIALWYFTSKHKDRWMRRQNKRNKQKRREKKHFEQFHFGWMASQSANCIHYVDRMWRGSSLRSFRDDRTTSHSRDISQFERIEPRLNHFGHWLIRSLAWSSCLRFDRFDRFACFRNRKSKSTK